MPLINGTLPDKYKEQIQSYSFTVVVPLVCLFAFSIGLPSNVLALFVLLFRTKKLPSTILLINLTICDLLLLLVLPFRIVYHFMGNNWTFGEPFCRVVIGLLYGNMYGSVVCLALIAMDRYIALVHPFGAKMLRSNKNSVCMSVLVWIVVLAAVVPLLASQQSYKITNLPLTTCHDALPIEKQEKYFLPYFAFLFSICFLLPLLVVLYCYSAVLRTLMAEGKRFAHAIRVTVLMLMVFVVACCLVTFSCFCITPNQLLTFMFHTRSLCLSAPSTAASILSSFIMCLRISERSYGRLSDVLGLIQSPPQNQGQRWPYYQRWAELKEKPDHEVSMTGMQIRRN